MTLTISIRGSLSSQGQNLIYSTYTQKLATLALAIPEIAGVEIENGSYNPDHAHITLTTPLLRVLCHSYAGAWHNLLPVYKIWPL